jgi:hypothetical protein
MSEPIFSRGEVAKILGVTPITIANREKNTKYPPADRDLNNYRIYTLADILNLQLLTFSKIDGAPVVSILYDKGYTNVKDVVRLVDEAISKRKGIGLENTSET